jgi:hypothetical protein
VSIIHTVDFVNPRPAFIMKLMRSLGALPHYRLALILNEIRDAPFPMLATEAASIGGVYKDRMFTLKRKRDTYSIWYEHPNFFLRVELDDMNRRLGKLYCTTSVGDLPVKVNRDFTTTMRVVYAICACDEANLEGAHAIYDMSKDKEL